MKKLLLGLVFVLSACSSQTEVISVKAKDGKDGADGVSCSVRRNDANTGAALRVAWRARQGAADRANWRSHSERKGLV